MKNICFKTNNEHGELKMIDLTKENIKTITETTEFIKDNVKKSKINESKIKSQGIKLQY